MAPDEQEQINILCERIATEQDQEKFMKLVQELNDLLDGKNLDRKNLDRKNPDPKNRRIDRPPSTEGSSSAV
ncbi:MAG: hypothetical protein ABSE44_11650 [Candidatus Sulfotelmatobacter sp.]|jgi:hypothetical protein